MNQTESKLRLLIKQMRPKQWTKNLLVFAALIFTLNEVHATTIINSILGFFCFCFVSSCVYILNDYIDRHSDKNHPKKKHRPMASGKLHPQKTLIFSFVLLFITLFSSFYIEKLFLLVLIVYYIINVLYSFWLKHIVILDVMVIASGFVLRAIGGGIVIKVPLTPWFLLCTLLLALFLAIGKRRHEFLLLKGGKGKHRKVLESYSENLLDQMNNIVATATIISYSMFTFNSGHSLNLMWTIPFVVYGIFRYLYLIHIEGKGGSPDQILLQDKHILITCILYTVSTVIILLFFE